MKNRKFENVAICVQLIKPVFWVCVHCTLLLLTIMSNKKSILISLHKQNNAYVIDTLIKDSLRLIFKHYNCFDTLFESSNIPSTQEK